MEIQTKQIMLPLNVLLGIVTPILFVASFFNRVFARNLYSYGGYYIIFGLFVLWLVSILRCALHEKFDIRSWLRNYRSGIILCIVLTAVIFISVKPITRVLCDETNLMGMAKSMTYEKRTDNVTMGKWYYDNFYPLNREMDKRPLLFPLLVSLIHTIVGYHAENVFVLNGLVLLSLFLLLYILGKNAFGEIWAAALVILVASQPLIIQCATSGGFELLAAFFLVVCFACLKWFLEKPDSALRFQFLWINLIVLASIRYEGIMSFILAVIILTSLRYIKRNFFAGNFNIIYFYTPLALLPNFLVSILIKNPFELKGNEPVFAARYFLKNSVDIYKSLLDFSFSLPYAAIVDFIGIIAVFFFINKFIEGIYPEEKGRRHLVIISASCVLVNFLSHCFYFQGWIWHASDARLFMAYTVVLSVLALMFMYSIDFLKKRPVYVLLFSIMMFFLYNPVSVEDRFSRTQTLPREYRFVLHYLKQEAVRTNNSFVVVTDRPGMYTVHNYGAVDFNNANSSNDLLDGFNNRLYGDIIVVQKIEYETQMPAKDNTLDKKYNLRPIAESQIDGTMFIRISRVLSAPPRLSNR